MRVSLRTTTNTIVLEFMFKRALGPAQDWDWNSVCVISFPNRILFTTLLWALVIQK